MNRFVAELRGRSHYPVYRGIASVVLGVGYLIAIVIVVSGLIVGDSASGYGFVALVVACAIAACVALFAHLLREVLLIAADAADALLDIASREAAPNEGMAPNLNWRDER